MFGRSKKKKKEKTMLSCPFCGEVFEDVSQHITECPAVMSSNAAASGTKEISISTAKPTEELPIVPLKSPHREQQAEEVKSISTSTSAPASAKRTLSPTPKIPLPVSPRKPLPPAPIQAQTEEKTNSPPPMIIPRVKSPRSPTSPGASSTNVGPLSPRKPPPEQPKVVTPRGAPSPTSDVSERPGPFDIAPDPPIEEEPIDWRRPRLQKSQGSSASFFMSRSQSKEAIDNAPEVIEHEDNDNVNPDEVYGVGLILYDYEKGSDVEISVNEGMRVYILDSSDPDWVYIGFDGMEGFIPGDYIEEEQSAATSTQNSNESATSPDVITNDNISTNNTREIPTEQSSSTAGEGGEASKLVRPPARRGPATTGDRTLPPKAKKSSYISTIGSTLRGKKKKKTAEFTIARADSPSPSPTSSAPNVTSISTPETFARQESVELAPSPPPVSADQRTNIAREILATESNYLNIIKAMINRYRELLISRLDLYSPSITKEMINEIFSNLEVIIPINEQLCNDLQAAVDAWTETSTIGDIFVRVAPFMKMYNQYSNRYDQALVTLGKCMKNEDFNSLVEEIDGTTKLGSRLESLLIAPIQRIPRYTLLLQELRKSTPEEHQDIGHLDKAIPLMQQVANYINSNISQVENQEKLLSLSLAGAQSLLKPHRVLLHEGIALDNKKKVHLWLFNDIIVHVPDNLAKDKGNLNKPKYQWPLHLLWVGDSSVKNKTQAQFNITGPTRSYTFTCLIEEVHEWVTKIENAVKQHLEYLSVTQDAELVEEKNAKMTYANPNRFGTFKFPNSATYTGWWTNGEFEGSGTFCFFDSVFVGEFTNSLKNGKGVLNFVTGEVYDGEWKDDKQNGKGVLTYPNGDNYNGNWLDGMKHGKGALTCVLGDTYVGEWANDHPQGLGEMGYRSGQVYNGNWENGLRHHYGILINPTGERYEGEWVAGVRHGKGRMEYFEGCYYDGYWKDGYKHGKGIYVSPEGRYEGEYVVDMREGTGTMTYANGKVYKGLWRRDFYHGQGTLTYPSGIIECYIGEWQNQKRQGSGILRLFNGDMYEGHFKDNRFHGTGSYSFGNGNSIKCKWNKGHISGECTFSKPAKPNEKKKEFIYTGTYKEGMIVGQDRPPIYIRTIPTGEIDLL